VKYRGTHRCKGGFIFGALCPSKSGLMNKHIVKHIVEGSWAVPSTRMRLGGRAPGVRRVSRKSSISSTDTGLCVFYRYLKCLDPLLSRKVAQGYRYPQESRLVWMGLVCCGQCITTGAKHKTSPPPCSTCLMSTNSSIQPHAGVKKSQGASWARLLNLISIE